MASSMMNRSQERSGPDSLQTQRRKNAAGGAMITDARLTAGAPTLRPCGALKTACCLTSRAPAVASPLGPRQPVDPWVDPASGLRASAP